MTNSLDQELVEKIDSAVIRCNRKTLPIVIFLGPYASRIQKYNAQFPVGSPSRDESEIEEIIKELGIALDTPRSPNYGLSPLEIASVWVELGEEYFLNIDLKESILMLLIHSSAVRSFASQQESPSSYFFKTPDERNALFGSQEDVNAYAARLEGIKASIRELGYYRLGVRTTLPELHESYQKGEDDGLYDAVRKKLCTNPMLFGLGYVVQSIPERIDELMGYLPRIKTKKEGMAVKSLQPQAL